MIKCVPFIVAVTVMAAFMVFDEGIKPLDEHDEIKLQQNESDQDGGTGYGDGGGEDTDDVSV